MTTSGVRLSDAVVTVLPGQASNVTLTGAADRDFVEVAVEDADGLQADNVRYAVLRTGGAVSVLLVTVVGSVSLICVSVPVRSS